jgi:hypothetical protein
VADLLERIAGEIEGRRAELEPMIAEYDRLQVAAAALGGTGRLSRPGASGPRRSRITAPSRAANAGAYVAKPAASGRKPRRRRRGAGRPKGSGKRAAQALAAIARQPGITNAELAKTIDVNPTYLYRVVPGLVSAGKVVKDGKGYRPA